MSGLPVKVEAADAIEATPLPEAEATPRWHYRDHQKDVGSILAIHAYKRKDWSWSEHSFIRKFIRPLGMQSDKFHNFWKVIGPDAKPKILWSCHLDTVHSTEGFQELAIQGGRKLKLANKEKVSNCLGADDGAGIWLLLEMMKAGIPGLYVFHRCEEAGGQGSRFILKHHPELLDGIEAAVAFDRKGSKDIITHQGSKRTCSDAFALSLAEQLGMQHKPDDSGTFTDTKVYAETVPECTNVSCGYENAHWNGEWLDLEYLINLRDAVLKMDLSKLVIERDPAIVEWKKFKPYQYHDHGKSNGHYYGYGKGHLAGDQGWEGDYNGHAFDKYTPPKSYKEPSTILDFVKQKPDEIADMLEHWGFDLKMLQQYVDDSKKGLALPVAKD